MDRAGILIVEDERIVARDIEESLSELGYEVLGIASGYEEAVRLAAELRPNLILMDILLGDEKDGIEAAQQVRDELGVPIVFLTAHADAQTIERAKTADPYGYVLKPFEERDLHVCVEMALHKHRIENQLREEREWLATVLRSIGDAVITTDHEGRIKTFNPVAEALTGWPQDDAEGKPLEEVFHIVDEATRAPGEDPVKKVLASGKIVGLANHTLLIARNGDERPIADSGSPIRDPDGHVSGVVLVFRDATQERELAESHRMSALGELAGGIAHSLNNMLMAIIGFSDLALGQLDTGNPARDSVEKARTAAHTSEELTRQILAFAGRQVLDSEVLDLNELVTEVQRLLSQLIEAAIEIHCVTGEPVFADVDRAQVTQVVLNLALNARDAMPDGGKLTIGVSTLERSEADSISQPTVPPGPYAVLTVSDTGFGMDQGTLSRIFEPFFTRNTVGNGTGLGLAVAHGVMKQSGGHLLVESKLGEGTTFRAYFPRVSEPQDSRFAAVATRSRLKNSEVILVVEDEELVRDVSKLILESAGFTVLVAANGSDAKSVSEQYEGTIDLLLSDVIMPGATGPESVADLMASRPNLEVLYMSGYAQDDIVSRWGLDPGVNFVQKPVGAESLIQKVCDILDGRTRNTHRE